MSTAPYIYIDSNISKCVAKCPESSPYVDMTSIYLTCISECPEGT